MAKTISSLNVILGATVAPFTRAFGAAETSATSLMGKLSEVGSTILTLTGAGLAFGAIRDVFGSVASSLSLTSQLEQNAVAFETMFRSADTAKVVMSQLQAFAAETPFEFPELASAAKLLVAFGTSADQVVPTLRQLGDLAAGVGKPVGELAAIFGKVQVAGKLTGETLQQFNEHGIPLIASLSTKLGVAQSEIAKLVSDGKIGFADVQGALKGLTSTGGQFAGMMEKQSHTLGGLWSTLSDNISMTLAGVTQTLIDAFGIKPALGVLIASTSKAGDYITSAVSLYAPIVLEAGRSIYAGLTSTFSALYGIIAPPIVATYQFVVQTWAAMRGAVVAEADYIYRQASTAFKSLYASVSPIVDRVGAGLSAAFSYAAKAASQASEIIGGTVGPIVNVALQSDNLIAGAQTLAIVAGVVAGGFVAWQAATYAVTAAQIAATIVVEGYGVASTAIVAINGMVVAGQWLAATAITAVSGSVNIVAVAQGAWAAVMGTVSAAQWAVTAATTAGQLALSGVAAVLAVAKIAGLEYFAAIAAGVITQQAQAAAEYLMAGATAAGTAVKWAAVSAISAAQMAIVAYGIACETMTVAELAGVAVRAAATAGQWLLNAAATAGTAIYGVLTSGISLASIASGAWAVVTGGVTAAQWLLNAALTANPIGLVVVAVGALTVGLGVLAAKFINFSGIIAWAKNAFDVCAYAITNWQDTLKLAGTEAALFGVRTASQIAYTFTEVIPATLTWFSQNWRTIFTDIVNYTSTVFTNLLTNAANFGVALWEAVKGNGFTFNWTPLTDGFKAATQELPKIADRQVGPLESRLAKSAEEMGKKFRDGVALYAAKGTVPPAMAGAVEAGKAVTAAVQPELVVKPPIMDASGVTKPLDKVAEKAKAAKTAVQGLDAVLSGSAESQRAMYIAPTVEPDTVAAPVTQAAMEQATGAASADQSAGGGKVSELLAAGNAQRQLLLNIAQKAPTKTPQPVNI